MKCPRCGYFNVPGVQTCGQCRSALSATPAAGTDRGAIPFDELYPPRARDRTSADRIREPLRRRTRRLRPVAERIRESVDSLRATALPAGSYDGKPWLIASLAVVPGLGHLYQKRWRRAALLLAALAVCLCAAVLLIRHPLSDALVWVVLGLSAYSVWDAADAEFPAAIGDDARRLRSLRLCMVSVGVVASTVFTAYWVAGRWYDFWVFQTDQAMPAFQRGDGLVVRRRERGGDRPLQRGDVAVYFANGGLQGVPLTERVVGLPGDRIESRGDTLLVNGTPVPPARLPLTFRTPLPPLGVTVPDGTVCLWRGVNAGNEAETVPAPYVLISDDQIQGRAIARYQPPERRRWFR